MKLENKVALVTGGSSGIGKAIAETLSSEGALVVVFDRQDAENRNTKIEFIEGDVTRQESVQSCVDSILKDHSRLDILINNAGIAHVGTASTTSEEDFDKIYNVNIKGVYNCLHSVLPAMKKVGGGVIVNMASIAAHLGLPDRFAYSTSKGAVLAMTYSVARDYMSAGIRCNSISPARIHTPFVDGFIEKNYPGEEEKMFEVLSKSQPIGRMGSPEEVAKMVLFLCSSDAEFITGTDFPLDGGFIKLNT